MEQHVVLASCCVGSFNVMRAALYRCGRRFLISGLSAMRNELLDVIGQHFSEHAGQYMGIVYVCLREQQWTAWPLSSASAPMACMTCNFNSASVVRAQDLLERFLDYMDDGDGRQSMVVYSC